MRYIAVIDIYEEVVDDSREWCIPPVALRCLARRESAVGVFFCILFLWWLMIPELMFMAILYVIGFIIYIALCLVPILNICILIDSWRDESNFGVVLSIIGIIIDIIVAIILFIS